MILLDQLKFEDESSGFWVQFSHSNLGEIRSNWFLKYLSEFAVAVVPEHYIRRPPITPSETPEVYRPAIGYHGHVESVEGGEAVVNSFPEDYIGSRVTDITYFDLTGARPKSFVHSFDYYPLFVPLDPGRHALVSRGERAIARQISKSLFEFVN